MHTVIFDAGLTLLGARPTFWDAFVRGISDAGAVLPDVDGEVDDHPLGDLWRQHEAAWQETGELSPHLGDDDVELRYWRGLYSRFLAHLEVDGDHHLIAEHIHRRFSSPGTFRPFDDVAHTLDELEERGVRIGLLSNWGRSLRAILEHESLHDRFEAVVISGEVGLAKPDPEIFRVALRRLGLEPGPDVAYVGDSLTDDIEPAKALGLTAVLIDRWDRHQDHDGPRIVELSDLLTALPLPGRVGG